MVRAWLVVAVWLSAPPETSGGAKPPEVPPPAVQRPSNWAGPGTPVRKPVPPAATPPTTAVPAPATDRANAPTTAIPAPAPDRTSATTTTFPAPAVDRADAPVQAQPAPPAGSVSSPTTSTLPPSVDSLELTPVGWSDDDRISVRRPPPPPGTGMIVGGAGAIGASAFTSVVGVVALGLSAELGAPSPAAGAVLGLGLVGAAGGTALLVFGVRRRSAYRGWMREQGIVKGKPAGHGLLVGGPMTMVGGVTLLAVGGGDVTASILGGVTLAGGIGMTTAGALRKRKYEAWAKRFELASVVPSVVPIERGAVLGWSGRF